MKKNKYALYLGSIAGTDLYIHWTFLLLAVWVFFDSYRTASDWSAALLSLGFLLSVFGSITLHELGHIQVAKRYGCPTRNITLYPIGGVASLEKIPEKPYQELRMAAAGPFVSLCIAAVLLVVISISDGVPKFHAMEMLTTQNFLYNLMFVNAALLVFNMIPAFPMDGGRIFRALLAMRYDRVKATRIAATTGYVIALMGIAAGLFVSGWLVIIGIVVIIGARGELFMEYNRAVLRGHAVADAMLSDYTVLLPHDSLGHVSKLLIAGREKNFIVQNGDSHFGAVSLADVMSGLQSGGSGNQVKQIMHVDVPAVDIKASLQEAFHVMIAKGYAICPVTASGKMVGVLEVENVNEFVALHLAKERTKHQDRNSR